MAKPKPLAKLPRSQRDKRIAELVKNPGTRASIPTNLLPAKYRRMREQNTRLAQPIVDGSSITNRALGREANAAVSTRYGQAESEINQEIATRQKREGEVASYYDAYLKQLKDHQANAAAAQQQAQAQIAGLANIQGPAAGAPQDTGNQATAANAQAIREALLGAMKGALVEGGRAASSYADTLSTVVGPGQKLQAQVKAGENTQAARKTLTDLGREKGSYREQFIAQARDDETKNILSRQALDLDTTKADEDAAAGRATRREQRRSNRAKETNTANANKQASADRKATGYGAGRPGQNSFGYTYDEWNALTPAQRSKARAGKPKEGEKKSAQQRYDEQFYKKYGVKPASADAVRDGRDSIDAAGSFIGQVINSDDTDIKKYNLPQLVKSDPKQARRIIGELLLGNDVKGRWATVALDQYFLDGRISAGTASRLHQDGFSVKQLGLSTARAKTPKPTTKPPKSRSGTDPFGTDLGRLPGAAG